MTDEKEPEDIRRAESLISAVKTNRFALKFYFITKVLRSRDKDSVPKEFITYGVYGRDWVSLAAMSPNCTQNLLHLSLLIFDWKGLCSLTDLIPTITAQEKLESYLAVSVLSRWMVAFQSVSLCANETHRCRVTHSRARLNRACVFILW